MKYLKKKIVLGSCRSQRKLQLSYKIYPHQNLNEKLMITLKRTAPRGYCLLPSF
jgi:hypothetical protein